MSGFTSFLKKLGQIVLKVTEDASLVIPILQPLQMFLPKGVNTLLTSVENVAKDKLQTITDLVQQVELMKAAETGAASGTGSAKAAAITPFVSALFQDIELIGGKKVSQVIKDPKKFNDAMTRIAGDVADALNACGE
jgi:hypothetical protein